MLEYKKCVRCEKHKKLEEFSKQSGNPTGLQSWCRECVNRYGQERRDSRVKCAHCDELKLPSEFNVDKAKANGLTSYCKQCNAERAEQWRNSKMATKEQRDLIDLYRQAYAEGYYKSTLPTHTGKVRDAKKYANEIFPEIPEAVLKYRQYSLARKDNPNLEKTPQTELGNLIVHNLRRLIPKSRRPVINKKPIMLTTDELKEKRGHGVKKSIEDWIAKNDFIPTDEFIAHITGVTYEHSRDTRADLRKLGYDFEEIEYGWKVNKRPSKEKTIEEMSKDEVVAMLRKLLS